jgi:plastocyanin
MMMTRSGFMKGALLMAAAAVAACGSSSPSSPSSANSNSPTIAIVGQNGTQSFTPNPSSFGGQQIVFKNNDAVTHHIVLNDGSADTGDIAPGATSRTLAIPAAGTNYHCSIHPGMVGAVNAASGAAAPPCEGPYCGSY